MVVRPPAALVRRVDGYNQRKLHFSNHRSQTQDELQRPLFIGLFVVFLGTILSVVYVDNTTAAFLDWAHRHTIAYYRIGETVRSTVFPCTLTLSQVFLGRAANYFPSTGSWLVSFPSSLHAFLLILIPFTATTLLFGEASVDGFVLSGDCPKPW